MIYDKKVVHVTDIHQIKKLKYIVNKPATQLRCYDSTNPRYSGAGSDAIVSKKTKTIINNDVASRLSACANYNMSI